MSVIINSAKSINGTLIVPGDKSLTHRVLMLGALAEGDTRIKDFLRCADTISTISCLQKLGISIEDLGDGDILIHGKGLHGLKEPNAVLNVGNSGTTTRLLTGILAAQPFPSEIRGDDSLNKRPMRRIVEPLLLMGANIIGSTELYSTPIHIDGNPLKAITYITPMASAQIKSSILFAGMFANGATKITEPYITRNHTEQIMRLFGVNIKTDTSTVLIEPEPTLYGQDIHVPGDLSSAAFLMTAALILPNSEILLKHVGINESRLGFISIVQQMGGNITLLNATGGIEPCADILVKTSSLHGTIIEKDVIPTVIDELPILSVLACYAQGHTEIRDAADLKYKESDRIDAMTENLRRMGADITATEDGMIIEGGKPMHGAIVGSRLDHRICMSLAIAGLCAKGETEIIGSECVSVSYPDFYRDLKKLCKY